MDYFTAAICNHRFEYNNLSNIFDEIFYSELATLRLNQFACGYAYSGNFSFDIFYNFNIADVMVENYKEMVKNHNRAISIYKIHDKLFYAVFHLDNIPQGECAKINVLLDDIKSYFDSMDAELIILDIKEILDNRYRIIRLDDVPRCRNYVDGMVDLVDYIFFDRDYYEDASYLIFGEDNTKLSNNNSIFSFIVNKEKSPYFEVLSCKSQTSLVDFIFSEYLFINKCLDGSIGEVRFKPVNFDLFTDMIIYGE